MTEPRRISREDAAARAREYAECFTPAQKEELLSLASRIAGESPAQEIFRNTMLVIAVSDIKSDCRSPRIFENAHFILSERERYEEIVDYLFKNLEPLGIKKVDYRPRIER